MSPSLFLCASCCQCIWHSIWPCLQHRRYMITLRKCHDIMLLTVRIFFKSTQTADDPPSVRWADVNRSQVLAYKAYSAPEGQWKWDPKVSQFHMLIFNSCCLQKPFFCVVNAEACLRPMSHKVFRRDKLCLKLKISFVFDLHPHDYIFFLKQ